MILPSDSFRTWSKIWRGGFILSAIVLIGLVCVFVYTYEHCHHLTPDLPSDLDVSHLEMEVYAMDGQINGIPRTRIPDKYIAQILTLFQPVTMSDYPAEWNRSFAIGKLIIETRQERYIEILVVAPGKWPLCFSINGVRCIRGGDCRPIVDIVIDGQQYGYADEGGLLRCVFEEIYREQVTGKESEKLQDYFMDLARSAGKLPPRKKAGGKK